MKLYIFFVISLIFFVSFCSKKDEARLLTRDCRGSDTCQAKLYYDHNGKPVANTVLIKKETKLRFIKSPEISKAVFIIPKADIIFKKLHSNQYDSLMIGNTNYLFITLTNKHSSKQFMIRTESNLLDSPKYYPYSVYLPIEDKMAESNSSPAIIVDP